MIDFIKAKSDKDFFLIEKLADTIWRAHYIPIVGKPQIDYMLEKFQSFDTIKAQIENGFIYFIIKKAKKNIGYLAIKPQNEDLFLSKIYILENERGKGYGKNALNFVEDKAKKYNCKRIYLTVNKGNYNSIKAYKSFGFINAEKIVIDIGSGFVMDDYKMIKNLA